MRLDNICVYLLFEMSRGASGRRETGTEIGQTGKTENRIGYQIFFVKTENQMLKNGKYANRNEHLNRETDVFWNKNRKTDLKNR